MRRITRRTIAVLVTGIAASIIALASPASATTNACDDRWQPGDVPCQQN